MERSTQREQLPGDALAVRNRQRQTSKATARPYQAFHYLLRQLPYHQLDLPRLMHSPIFFGIRVQTNDQIRRELNRRLTLC